jgi:hypothetical protein
VTRFSRISKNPVVPAKVKLVFEMMQNDPAMTAQAASARVGISYYNFRRSLKLPHVAVWLREVHKAKVDAICAANPERLRVIADTSENHMARVGAIKTLEAMKEALDPHAASHQLPQPGLVIVIQNRDGSEVDALTPPPPAPMIEAEVLPERVAEQQIEP